MSVIRAIGYRLMLAALFVYALSFSVRGDEIGEFHAAVERATAQYHLVMQTLETSGQAETAAAVHRFREAWQAIFASKDRPPLPDGEQYSTMMMLVDTRLVGVLLVIDLGNRDAAREGLAPIQDALAELSSRSAPK